MNYWNAKDFENNKLYWKDRSPSENIKTREQNLILVNNLLLENEIFFFLEGRTLKSIFENQQFDLNDHDDDIGVFYTDKEKIYNLVDSFKQLGFEIIRSNELMISFIREFRYIDICLFKKKYFKVGYGKKMFPFKYYKNFDQIKFLNINFNIPILTKDLMDLRYGR